MVATSAMPSTMLRSDNFGGVVGKSMGDKVVDKISLLSKKVSGACAIQLMGCPHRHAEN